MSVPPGEAVPGRAPAARLAVVRSDGDREAFVSFARDLEPRLRRALAGCRGVQGAPDAVAEALAYAWEHWDRVSAMENPAGYLYRVGQSRTKARKEGMLPAPADVGLPDIEPALVPALLALPETQRTAVWLVHACGWSYAECAAAMEVSVSAVGTHVSRALAALRGAFPNDEEANDA